MHVCFSILILQALYEKLFRGRQKVFFCQLLFCVDAFIVGGLGGMEWNRRSYLGPTEIESCLLLRLKSQSARGASRHLVFMLLVLIKGIRREGESKISFSPRSLRHSPQTYHERGGLI